MNIIVNIFQSTHFLGKNCHNKSLWQTIEHERGTICHKLDPPEPNIYTPHSTLDLSFFIDPPTASPLAFNALQMNLVFAIPGTELSARKNNGLGSRGFPGFSKIIIGVLGFWCLWKNDRNSFFFSIVVLLNLTY